MTTVLGIDPGSRVTGYGLVTQVGSELRYVDSGTILLGSDPMPNRLRKLHLDLTDLIETHRFERYAVESTFMSENAMSALKLGQARGVAIAACALYNIEFAEYSPREVKKALVGTGGADKEQVQYMVKLLLNLEHEPAADEADALAVAICDINSTRFRNTVASIETR